MCNFYMGVKVTKTEHLKLLTIEKELGTLSLMKELQKMRNGFVYGNAEILKKISDTDFEIVQAHWEFIPPWIKNMEELKEARKKGIPWLNARSEKLSESKMFRPAALNRRCLVLASSFFEWRHYQPEGSKKPMTYPYNIAVADRNYFFMAGIWQPWTDKETGETMDTFAIVTTKANEMMEMIHNTKKRMPTILTEELAWEWLMEDLPEERIKEIASYQLPSEFLAVHTVHKEFKILEEPTEEFEYAELPPMDIAL